jgi:hypothetical protein
VGVILVAFGGGLVIVAAFLPWASLLNDRAEGESVALTPAPTFAAAGVDRVRRPG